jgi:hypothetical protein
MLLHSNSQESAAVLNEELSVLMYERSCHTGTMSPKRELLAHLALFRMGVLVCG